MVNLLDRLAITQGLRMRFALAMAGTHVSDIVNDEVLSWNTIASMRSASTANVSIRKPKRSSKN